MNKKNKYIRQFINEHNLISEYGIFDLDTITNAVPGLKDKLSGDGTIHPVWGKIKNFLWPQKPKPAIKYNTPENPPWTNPKYTKNMSHLPDEYEGLSWDEMQKVKNTKITGKPKIPTYVDSTSKFKGQTDAAKQDSLDKRYGFSEIKLKEILTQNITEAVKPATVKKLKKELDNSLKVIRKNNFSISREFNKIDRNKSKKAMSMYKKFIIEYQIRMHKLLREMK
jgi:hypothetical protein